MRRGQAPSLRSRTERQRQVLHQGRLIRPLLRLANQGSYHQLPRHTVGRSHPLKTHHRAGCSRGKGVSGEFAEATQLVSRGMLFGSFGSVEFLFNIRPTINIIVLQWRLVCGVGCQVLGEACFKHERHRVFQFVWL